MLSFVVVSAALLLTSANASPAPASGPPTHLSIPITDIVKGNYSSHEDHEHFAKFARWLNAPGPGSIMKRNVTGLASKHPALASVDCFGDESPCYLRSRLVIDDDTISALEYHKSKSNDLFKRGWLAQDIYSETHAKTYVNVIDEDDDPDGGDGHTIQFGAEHYMDNNFHCKTLDYRSTGYALKDHRIDIVHANVVNTWLQTELLDTSNGHQVVELTAHFQCGTFGNKCCTSDAWGAKLIIDDNPSSFAAKTTFECNYGKNLGGTQC